MIDRLLSLCALVVLVGFLGILLWFVPRFDLGAVIGVTLLFVLYDFFLSKGRAGGS